MREEKLFDAFAAIDDALLDDAYRISDAASLSAYAKKEKKSHKALLTRIAAFAAAAALLLGVSFGIPALFSQDRISDAPDAPPPWLSSDLSDIRIGSLDMMNYYAAIRLLTEENAQSAFRAKEGRYTAWGTVSVTRAPMADGVGYDTPPAGETDGKTDSEASRVIYYELDPNEVFTVNCAVFFQIELTDPNGFLASMLGTGIVDVVITENSLEPMITFKKGDQYFSCCANTTFEDGVLYSTHKYIEGFYLVKNLEQDNYSFRVIYKNYDADYLGAKAKELLCESYKNGGSIPDGRLKVSGETYVSRGSFAFTVQDLESYFENVKPPVIYESDQAVFTFYTDASFTYHRKAGAAYRKGNYEKNEHGYLLILADGGAIELTVKEDSFLYEGEFFVLASEKWHEGH